MRQATVITVFALLAASSFARAKGSVQQCDSQSTEIPIVAKAFTEGIRACKFPDGFRILNNAGEQVYIEKGKDGESRVCVKIAQPRQVKGQKAVSGGGQKLCCPQVNTGDKVQVAGGRYENNKGSRFECEKDKQGKDKNSLKVSRVDKGGGFVSGSDSFKITGRLTDEKDNSGRTISKSKIEITQVQGGTGGGSNPQEGIMELETEVGKGGGTGDDTCDSSRKCKVVDLIASKSLLLNPETKKYEPQKGGPYQSKREGERAFSADAGVGH